MCGNHICVVDRSLSSCSLSSCRLYYPCSALSCLFIPLNSQMWAEVLLFLSEALINHNNEMTHLWNTWVLLWVNSKLHKFKRSEEISTSLWLMTPGQISLTWLSCCETLSLYKQHHQEIRSDCTLRFKRLFYSPNLHATSPNSQFLSWTLAFGRDVVLIFWQSFELRGSWGFK